MSKPGKPTRHNKTSGKGDAGSPEKKMTRHDIDLYKFDKSIGSWRGPVLVSLAASKCSSQQHVFEKLSKLRKNKEKQDELQKNTKLRIHKEALDGHYSDDFSDDEEKDQDMSEDTLSEAPNIQRPFSSLKLESPSRYANWSGPRKTMQSNRVNEFEWKKPIGSDGTCFTSPAQQLVRLQKVLEEKEKDMAILRKSLMKAQEDNYELIKELEGYRGEHYEDMKIENIRLKEHVKILTKEATKLRGLQRAQGNSILIKMQQERDASMEALYKQHQQKFGPVNKMSSKSKSQGTKKSHHVSFDPSQVQSSTPDSESHGKLDNQQTMQQAESMDSVDYSDKFEES